MAAMAAMGAIAKAKPKAVCKAMVKPLATRLVVAHVLGALGAMVACRAFPAVQVILVPAIRRPPTRLAVPLDATAMSGCSGSLHAKPLFQEDSQKKTI